MRVDENQVVSLHYKLSKESGEVIDSSESQGPLEIIQGGGLLLPALEEQLHGHVAGDVFKVTLKPEQAYGDAHPELLQFVPRHAFDGQNIDIGARFKAKNKEGVEQMLTVKEIGINEVTVDANHPLAGHTLVFDIAIVSVRPATAIEIETGEIEPGKLK